MLDDAVVLILAATASVQFGSALAATLFDDIGPAGATLLRTAFAAAILAALWRPRPSRHRRRDLALAGGFGAVLGAMNLLFYLSIDRIPLGITVMLEFLGPLGLAIALSRRRLDLVWVTLAGFGVALLSGGDVSNLDPVGIAFALAAGCLWATYILLATRLGKAFPGGSGLAIGLLVSTILLIPAGVVGAGHALLDPRTLVLAAAVAVLSSAIPYSLELEALRRLPARVFGVLMSLEPAVAAVAGFLVLDQSLAWTEGLAIGLVVVASSGAAATAVQRSGSAARAEGGCDCGRLRPDPDTT